MKLDERAGMAPEPDRRAVTAMDRLYRAVRNIASHALAALSAVLAPVVAR